MSNRKRSSGVISNPCNMDPLSDFLKGSLNDYRISSTHIGIFAALVQYSADRGHYRGSEVSHLSVATLYSKVSRNEIPVCK